MVLLRPSAPTTTVTMTVMKLNFLENFVFRMKQKHRNLCHHHRLYARKTLDLCERVLCFTRSVSKELYKFVIAYRVKLAANRQAHALTTVYPETNTHLYGAGDVQCHCHRAHFDLSPLSLASESKRSSCVYINWHRILWVFKDSLFL